MSEDTNLVTLTADIVAAHVANNSIAPADVSDLIGTVYAALSGLGAPTPEEPTRPQGAVSARKSLANSAHILSMIDGKPYKVLRRHISQHGYTPDSYRDAFGLAHDYPMVARDYAERRRALAHEIGLGRKSNTQPVAAVPVTSVPSHAVTGAPAAAAAKPARRTLKPVFDKPAAPPTDTTSA